VGRARACEREELYWVPMKMQHLYFPDIFLKT
jgi:hypothetical protein